MPPALGRHQCSWLVHSDRGADVYTVPDRRIFLVRSDFIQNCLVRGPDLVLCLDFRIKVFVNRCLWPARGGGLREISYETSDNQIFFSRSLLCKRLHVEISATGSSHYFWWDLSTYCGWLIRKWKRWYAISCPNGWALIINTSHRMGWWLRSLSAWKSTCATLSNRLALKLWDEMQQLLCCEIVHQFRECNQLYFLVTPALWLHYWWIITCVSWHLFNLSSSTFK